MQPGIDAPVIFQQPPLRVTQDGECRYLINENDAVLSAMSLQSSATLCLPCMQAMMMALLFVPQPRRVLQLGLGGGDSVRFLRNAYPECHISAVEFDSHIVRLAQQYFELPKPDAHFTLIIDDAAHALQMEKAFYDLILLDIVTDMQQPDDYQGFELLQHCATRLQTEGVLAINFIVSDTAVLADFSSRLQQVFRGPIYCLPVARHHNIMLFVFNNERLAVSQAALLKLAATLVPRFELPLVQLAAEIRQLK